jgi:hypothetical protein
MSTKEEKVENGLEKTEKIEIISENEETKVEIQPSEIHPDDEKRTGIKESAVDSEAIAIEQNKAVSTEPEKIPSFFIEKGDRRRIEIDILASKLDGKIVSISRTGLGVNFDEFPELRHSTEWFEFSIPHYEDISSYRQRCAVYRREAGQMLVDKLRMRNFLLVWHLKDWSLVDRNGEKVILNHDEDGSLEDVSLKKVYSIHPTIIDVVMTILEKDTLLT